MLFAASVLLSQHRGWDKVVATPGKLLAYPNSQPEVKQADLLTSIQGVQFDDCFGRSMPVLFGNLRLDVVSRADLIHMKQVSAASGDDLAARQKDLADIAALRALGHD